MNANSTERTYDHHEITDKDRKGNIKITHLDAHHRVHHIEEINAGNSYITVYGYNAADQLIKVTNALGHNTHNVYDYLGRKVAMCDPNMGTAPGLTNCTTTTPGAWVYTFNKAGDLLSQTDAKGQKMCFDYDLVGRQTFKREGSNCGPNTGIVRVQWSYDTSTISPPPVGGDYPIGRLTQVHQPAASNGTFTTSEVKTQFAYDKLGRPLQTNRLLNGTWYAMKQSYDALGRVTSEQFPDNDTVTYTYDSAGLLKAVNASSGIQYVSDIT